MTTTCSVLGTGMEGGKNKRSRREKEEGRLNHPRKLKPMGRSVAIVVVVWSLEVF